jgi:hypothetical protein
VSSASGRNERIGDFGRVLITASTGHHRTSSALAGCVELIGYRASTRSIRLELLGSRSGRRSTASGKRVAAGFPESPTRLHVLEAFMLHSFLNSGRIPADRPPWPSPGRPAGRSHD